MKKTYYGNEYRNILLCVDSYHEGELCGRMYNPGLDGGVEYHNVMQMLLAVERLLDGLNFPQRFTLHRSFTGSLDPTPEVPEQIGTERGRAATFLVKIFFRQNASWQGVVSWQDQSQEESFRSVLELLMLMHSALSAPCAE